MSDDAPSFATLHRYARKRLGAAAYPRDYHPWSVYGCPDCGLVPLTLRIEHHTGSTVPKFRGLVFARCTACGRTRRIFGFTGAHRVAEREERPICRCGSEGFYVARLDRIEGGEMAGFYDEGVIVGECAACGVHTTFVEID